MFVDAVAEPHHFLFLDQGAFHPGFGAGRRFLRDSCGRMPNFVKGVHHSLVGAAMQRPLKAHMAPVTAECRSESVDVITLAVKVEALNECSA